MKINGEHYRTVRYDSATEQVFIIDQTCLPFELRWLELKTLDDACVAIADMQVRGAPAIGAVAAFGMVLAAKADSSRASLQSAAQSLKATRPTAVNLAWAVNRMLASLEPVVEGERYQLACNVAVAVCEEDVAVNSAIGDAGCVLIADIADRKNGDVVNILTHCNAGWLATVDWGTALSPVYKAHEQGIKLHVWVDETRPRNQGASLTAFELQQQGVSCTLISDNAGGHLMQHGLVDLCIVGSDRTAANGDVCNKIGTYLKALAARDNQVPFYVALPTSTIDWELEAGRLIPIEERSEDEVLFVQGITEGGSVQSVRITPEGVRAANPAFDVTPAALVTGLITEKGLVSADPEALTALKGELDG